MRLPLFFVCAFLAAVISTPGPAAAAKTYEAYELEDLAEPIALYPDLLLQAMLPAATFPDQIIDAALLIKDNADAEKIKSQKWDDSVKAVASYPGILKMMNENLQWTTEIGQAFLNQHRELLDAIQRLRGKAQTLGNLQSNETQKVTQTTSSSGSTVIVVEPKDPEVVYVPSAPSTVYVEHHEEPDYTPLVTFGAGLLIGAAIANNDDDHDDHYYYGGWGAPGGWYHNDDNFDKWQDNRRAVWEDYNDRAWDRQEFRQDAASDRRDFRQDMYDEGKYQPRTTEQRQAAKQNVQDRRGNVSAENQKKLQDKRNNISASNQQTVQDRRNQASANQQNRSASMSSANLEQARANQQAKTKAQGRSGSYSSSGAFQGYSSRAATSQYSNRGAASRSSMSRGSYGGGGRASRGGGGRRR